MPTLTKLKLRRVRWRRPEQKPTEAWEEHGTFNQNVFHEGMNYIEVSYTITVEAES